MLNIGAGEIALIVVVALLVLGPTRLPELARGIGRFMREFRSRTDEVRHVVEREFYRMDEEVQALPPRSIAPPSAIGRQSTAGSESGTPASSGQMPPPAVTPPSGPSPSLPGQDAALHAPPTFVPDTIPLESRPLDPIWGATPPGSQRSDSEPLDPSFARTQANPILRDDAAPKQDGGPSGSGERKP